MSLFEELKRRNVIRVGIAYAVTCWLLLQVADIVLDNTAAPDWVMQVIMLVMAIGLPLVLLFSWAFEMTPEGLKRERDVDRSSSITHQTGRKLDFAIIAILVVALGYFVWESRYAADETVPASSEATTTPAAGQLATAAPGIPEKSIAVLPFLNLSSDPEQEFFSDGISEELLNVLARYPGLQVAARTSSFQFKGQNKDIGEIARMLKVRHVLEGSVRKSGNQLRITAQLIEAENGYHLWSETYDRELDDVFAIQDEISAAIGEALRIELALQEDGSAAAPRVAESANTAAYEAFLHGRHLVNQRGRNNMAQALQELKRAVRLDPEFAPAQAWLGITWTMLLDSPTTYGTLTLTEVMANATPPTEKALELDSNLAEAWGAKGMLALNTGDFGQALEDLEHALELNPVYIDALNWSQIAATNYGEYGKSLALMRRMIEIDPLSIIGRFNYSQTLANLDFEAGRAMAADLVSQNAWTGYMALGGMELDIRGNLPAALELILRAYAADPSDELSNRRIIKLFAVVGESDEARRISDENLFIANLQQNELEGAVHSLSQALAADPDNLAAQTELADALHLARRFDASLSLYQKLRERSPIGLIFHTDDSSTRSSMRLALELKLAGDQQAAATLIARHREDLEARKAIGPWYASDWMSEAIARAVEGDDAGALEAIDMALQRGMRDRTFFREPAFDGLATHPEFLALKSEHDHALETDHQAIITMICTNNPIPDMWQPLAKTCMGVAANPAAATSS